MKRTLVLVLLFMLCGSIFTSKECVAIEKNFYTNPTPMYFENATYTLGRLYAIKQDPEILKEYNNLFPQRIHFALCLCTTTYTKPKR